MGLLIVTELEAAEPPYDPAPWPLHELRIYWVPVPPEEEVVTPKLAVVPVLYQPLPEGEP